jgi:hypothetical protein
MPMILPERTVDAWTASYITGRRWRARLWAPTERREGERYDLSVGFRSVSGLPVPAHSDVWPDKVFVFEHKGVDERSNGEPIVWIRLRQLLRHSLEDRIRGGNLVYYLLPDPDWRGYQPAPYGVVPDVTSRRTRGPKLPSGEYAWEGFQVWARVAHVEDVRRQLQRIYVTSPGRFRSRPGPRRGKPDWACALTMAEVRAIRNQVSLRDFLSGVRRCTHGRIAGDSRLGPRSPWLLPLRSLEEALEIGLEDLEGEDRPHEDLPAQGEKAEEDDLPEDEMSEVFERPFFTTVFGVGDSRLNVEEKPSSTLFS